jgi:hypothetical protein
MNALSIIEISTAEELDQLQVAIVDYDREVRSAFGRQMSYAFLAGAALLRAKEIIPHGKFMEWRESDLNVERSSAERYMKFAAAISKFPTVGNLREVKLLGSGEALTPAQQKKITDAVHDLTDGKTLTEMYRDLGVIRQPQKPKHHPQKPVSPEDELEARKLHDRDLADAWMGPLSLWRTANCADDDERPSYSREEWNMMLNHLTEATALCREHLGGRA